MSVPVQAADVGVAPVPAREASTTKPRNTGYFGLNLDYAFGVYNGRKYPLLPFAQYAFDSKFGIGTIFKFFLSNSVSINLSPGYAITGYQSMFFLKNNVLVHSLHMPFGFEWVPGRIGDFGIIFGGIMNYEFSGTLRPEVSVAPTSSALELKKQDLAQPKFGSYIGFVYYLNPGERMKTSGHGIVIALEMYESTLNYIFTGVKFGYQTGIYF